jgi:hypothetical protein
MLVIQLLNSLKIDSETCYGFSYVKSRTQIDGIKQMYDFMFSAYHKLV